MLLQYPGFAHLHLFQKCFEGIYQLKFADYWLLLGLLAPVNLNLQILLIPRTFCHLSDLQRNFDCQRHS